MAKIWIGIDNGVSGSIGWVGAETGFIKTPTFSELDYHKSKTSNVTRVDTSKLFYLLEGLTSGREAKVVVENPLSNPKLWKTSISAHRAHEAVLIVLDELDLPKEFTSSNEWQKMLLPKPRAKKKSKGEQTLKRKSRGAAEMKKLSVQIGKRLYPFLRKDIERHGDADGLLIAEWSKRSNL